MDNQFEQGKFIGKKASEILALERKQKLLIQQSKELQKEANLDRSILFNMITHLQESTPHELPGRFTVNGLLIDISGGEHSIHIQEVPELINHLEGEPTS
ncbi:hypothetical protein [Endozoicomonas atrinae]|uniref:hypothetical protein n=1 Tax=Endozoicomonas atrinae TaxID=1333660 RepID=UPI000825B6BD|nr:hypothetical protein [Endozoicomonas atrinae]